MKEQFFDFEVFPQWWCCVIGEYVDDETAKNESVKDNFHVISSDDFDARNRLLNLLTREDFVAIGYNNKKYDNIILNAISCSLTPTQVYTVSQIAIKGDDCEEALMYPMLISFAHKRYANFTYQDMLDDNAGSLKEKEACMELDIRESDVPFGKKDLTAAEKADIISYCKHDVWSGMQFYRIVLKPFVATKLLVGKVFNIAENVCYMCTNAKLSARALQATRKSFPDKDRQDIVIPDGLKSYITYSLPAEVVKKVCSSPENFDVQLFGNKVSYANGGIHSVPRENIIAGADEEWALINVDASSFYPAMMINWGLLSRGVQHPEKFKEMYEARLNFKKVIEPFEEKWGKNTHLAPKEEYEHYKSCKETSQAYKLILNTTYGASGNKYLDLYDPYHTTKTCRIGQLLLTSLANNIYNQLGSANVVILQTNTDGVLCLVKRDKIDLMHAIGDEFTRVTHILLEFEEEQKIWQKDVNNYIMLKKSGREKSKGGFFVTDMIQPGYNRVRPLNCYVCREAIKGLLMRGEDIVEHIYNEKRLSKFVMTYAKGSFSGIVREFTDGREDEVLQKTNRCYASLNTSLGEIKKLKRYKGEVRKYKAPGCPPHCELLNKSLDKYDMNEVSKDIDYMWYIQETLRLLSDVWYEVKDGKLIPVEILPEEYR